MNIYKNKKQKKNYHFMTKEEFINKKEKLCKFIDEMECKQFGDYCFYSLENPYYNYSKNKHIIYFDLYECGNKTKYNYMDSLISDYCNFLAEELWYFENRNIFFDLINGKIKIYI